MLDSNKDNLKLEAMKRIIGVSMEIIWASLNTLRLRENGHHLADDIFKCIFRNLDYNITEVCSQGTNWQYVSIGLDDGLAPNRCQVIIWTNDG